MYKKIIQNSFILSIGILVGRFSGFIRELLIARKFGTSEFADQIVLMLTVPDLLNNILAAGAISGILIPLLATHNDHLSKLLFIFIQKLFKLTIILYLIINFIFYLIYDWHLFSLLLVSTLSVFPNIIAFVTNSYLQYEKRFIAQSLGTLVFNTVIIICILINAINYWFALGVILAASIRMIWIISDIWRAGLHDNIFINKNKNFHINISYRVLIIVLLSNGLMFVLPIIDKMTASLLYEGSVATLSYAEKIYLLPVSVILTTYAVALLPDLARLANEKKYNIILTLVKRSVMINILLSSLVVIIFILFTKEIIYLIFGLLGNLDNNKLLAISEILTAYLPIILLAGSISVFINVLFTFKAYNKILLYSLFLLLLKITLCVAITHWEMQVRFIAWSSSFSNIVAFLGLGAICMHILKKGERNEIYDY